VWPEPTHGTGKRPVHTAAECIDWSLPCPSIFERKKPLAEKTMWRIAQGIKKFVLENATPFIVGAGGRARQTKPAPVDAPLGTVTAKNDRAVVVPVLTKFQQNSVGQSAEAPLDTVMAGAQRFGLVAPLLVETRNGERPTQAARVHDVLEPHRTVTAKGSQGALVTAFLNKHFGDPLRNDGGGGTVLGSELDAPMGTVTTRDHHSLTAATLVKLRGDNNGADVAEPMPTVTAGGGKGGRHIAEVRAFLVSYYGTGIGQNVTEPMRTVTTKDRLGLVTVEGVDYQIVDIGFRMLEPHELLRAQFGRFAAGYDMSAAESKKDKVRLIGNSVCPELVEQLVRANCAEMCRARRAA